MAEADLKQLNVHLDPGLVETAEGDGLVEVLEERLGLSRRDTVATAIRVLTTLLNMHDAYADQHDDEVAELYKRLARQAPAGFIRVPADGVEAGRVKGVPVVVVGDWLIFHDSASDSLFAEEQGGQGRVGVVQGGEIKPLKLPTPEEVVLN
jgi:hypothetical protein